MNDDDFMREALREAARAEARGEVPVGSVVVVGGEIIARAHNLRETAQDPTSHAELIAVRKAAARLGTWRLIGGHGLRHARAMPDVCRNAGQ